LRRIRRRRRNWEVDIELDISSSKSLFTRMLLPWTNWGEKRGYLSLTLFHCGSTSNTVFTAAVSFLSHFETLNVSLAMGLLLHGGRKLEPPLLSETFTIGGSEVAGYLLISKVSLIYNKR
jgi:hypothetical protein